MGPPCLNAPCLVMVTKELLLVTMELFTGYQGVGVVVVLMVEVGACRCWCTPLMRCSSWHIPSCPSSLRSSGKPCLTKVILHPLAPHPTYPTQTPWAPLGPHLPPSTSNHDLCNSSMVTASMCFGICNFFICLFVMCASGHKHRSSVQGGKVCTACAHVHTGALHVAQKAVLLVWRPNFGPMCT